MSAKSETAHIRPEGCICDPFDLAAMGHMTNCPCSAEDKPRPEKPKLDELMTEMQNFSVSVQRIMRQARIVDQPGFIRERTEELRSKFEGWGIADAFDWSDPNV